MSRHTPCDHISNPDSVALSFPTLQQKGPSCCSQAHVFHRFFFPRGHDPSTHVRRARSPVICWMTLLDGVILVPLHVPLHPSGTHTNPSLSRTRTHAQPHTTTHTTHKVNCIHTYLHTYVRMFVHDIYAIRDMLEQTEHTCRTYRHDLYRVFRGSFFIQVTTCQAGGVK